MNSTQTRSLEVSFLLNEQRRHWHQGKHRMLESLLEENLGLQFDRQDLLALIYHEIALREDAKETFSSQEYVARFPLYQAEIRRLFQVHHALASVGSLTGFSSIEEPVPISETVERRPEDWTGRIMSHYQVEKRLGAGGMGEVYLAQDLALGRQVALKFLPGTFSPGLRDRLLREATTSARLQHPCIATFYESGEPGGVAFIAMEYVAGQTLRERLKEGPLPVDQALAITASLLEALAHAHAIGILHRDIKPENIMITGEGSAKLLDFGIARQISTGADIQTDGRTQTAGAGQTQAGLVVGTPGYMAPEQIQCESLDARADLFSLGVVLYEALTGRQAFWSSTAIGRLAATLVREPPALNETRIPDELKSVMARALAHHRAERYPSAASFLTDLRRVPGFQTAGAVQESLMVLDLENLSAGGQEEWIGVGFAQAARKNLARIPGLRIATRERVLRTAKAREAPGGSKDVVDLGLVLGCRWTISGSYKKTDSLLRLAVRLTDVPTHQVVWSDEFSGPIEDMFTMQERLFQAVAANLNVPRLHSDPRTPVNVTVYERHVRGQQLWWAMDKNRMVEAQELFEEAIALDPGYAPALAGLAGMHALRFTFTVDPATLEMAESYARRALDSDPHLSEAHIWLGYIRFQQEAFHESYLAERKAIELDPGNYLGWYFAGSHLAVSSCRRCEAIELQKRLTGGTPDPDPHRWRKTEALKLLQRAVELDPTTNPCWVALGMLHLELGHAAEAEWCLRQALELENQGLAAWSGMAGFLGECLRSQAALEEAKACCLTGLEAIEKSNDAYRDTFRGIFLCALGRTTLQQGDRDAACAAFTQAALHLRGRPRARAGGHVMVQALAGLTQAGTGPESFKEALKLFDDPEHYNFGPFWCCTKEKSLLELARAAKALNRTEQAAHLLEQAMDHGSSEAEQELIIQARGKL